MFKKAFKKNLIAGLLVTIPAGLTYIILSFVITRVDRAMAPAIKGIFGPQGLRLMEEWHIPGMGFILLGLFIIGVGLFGTNFIGKKIVALGENFLHSGYLHKHQKGCGHHLLGRNCQFPKNGTYHIPPRAIKNTGDRML